MKLEEQIRAYGEQVEAHAMEVTASEGPAANEAGPGWAPPGRPRSDRTRLLVLCAAVVVVVLGIVAVAVRRDARVDTLDVVAPPDDAPVGAVDPPPPGEPDAPFSLWLSATRVPPGPSEVVAVLVNHFGSDAAFGVGALVERWDGQAFVPHRQVALCLDHWSCTAPLEPLDAQRAVPDIGVSATVEQPGPVERFSTDGLDVGWYRLSQPANERVVAAAIFEVAADAEAPAPLWPTDQPALTVAPAFVAPEAATLTLSAMVPGAKDVGELQEAVAGLSESAAVERWERGSWVAVTEVALAEGMRYGTAADRTARLPALEPGAYRIVRTGPLGRLVGSFWVRDRAPSPSAATPGTTVAAPAVDPVVPERHPWPAGPGEEALISGVLTITSDGCSAIGGRRAAWPAGTVFEADRTRVRLTDGRAYAVGSDLELGGGTHAATELTEPGRCPGSDVLFVF